MHQQAAQSWLAIAQLPTKLHRHWRMPRSGPGLDSPPYHPDPPLDSPAPHNHSDGRNVHSSGQQDAGQSISLWNLLSTGTPPGAAQPEAGFQAREVVLSAAQDEALARSCGDALAACDTNLDVSLHPSSADWCGRKVRPSGEVLELLLQFKADLDLAVQEAGVDGMAANVRTTLQEIKNQVDTVHGLTVQLQAVVASGEERFEETADADRKRWYREVLTLEALVRGT